jgi:hypothetical protein
MFGGLTTTSSLRPDSDPHTIECLIAQVRTGALPIQPYWTSPTPLLALDIGEWSHPLTDLIDDAVEPTLKRRNLELPVPAIAGAPCDLPAQVFLLHFDESSPPTMLAAGLTVTPGGATLHARLPRGLPDADYQLWARVGEPGTGTPRRLAWTLASEGRHFTVKPASTEDT